MEIMDFCQKVKKNLAEEIGEEMTLSVKQITKNNGVVLHGITVSKDGMNISPNIYMDGLYAAYEEAKAVSLRTPAHKKRQRKSSIVL